MKNPVAIPADPEIADVLKVKCLSCHAIGANGGQLYPELNGIGSRQTVARYLG